MVVSVEHFLNSLNEVAKQIESRLELLTGPLAGVLKREVGRRGSRCSQPNKFSDDLIGRHSARLNRSVDYLKVLVKTRAARTQFIAMPLNIINLGSTQAKSLGQVLQHRTFLCLVAVQFQAHAIQANVRQPSPHDIESGHFLGDKENFFTPFHCRRNQVGDCLRLARTWRALDDKVSIAFDFLDDQSLPLFA